MRGVYLSVAANPQFQFLKIYYVPARVEGQTLDQFAFE